MVKLVYRNRFQTDQGFAKQEIAANGSQPVSSESEKVNFLLICLVKSIIAEEFGKFADLSEVCLVEDSCVVGKIFKYIFKSQSTNIGVISRLVAHTINFALKIFKQNKVD